MDKRSCEASASRERDVKQFCQQMQVLLLGLAQELPTLLFLLISRSYLPHFLSDEASSTASSSAANGKNNVIFESQERGRQLLEALQLLESQDGTHLLIKHMNEQHALLGLCVEAIKTVRAVLSSSGTASGKRGSLVPLPL